jgi:hypothetical protein
MAQGNLNLVWSSRIGVVGWRLLFATIIGCSSDASGVARVYRGDAPARWHQRELTLYVSETPSAVGLSSRDLAAAVKDAAGVWTRSCALDVAVRTTAAEAKSARDGVNTVVVRTRSWCPDGVSVASECHDARLHALTRLYKSPPSPRSTEASIDEADIEINAVDNRWNIGRSDQRSGGTKNLEATLVHEMGHLFGLEHPDARAPDVHAMNYVMFHDPQEPNRPLRLEPNAAEIAMLCEIYGRRETKRWYFAIAGGLALLALSIAFFGRRFRTARRT